jgi:hypothetical protein
MQAVLEAYDADVPPPRQVVLSDLPTTAGIAKAGLAAFLR